MAGLPEAKLRMMEAEMDRFEREISSGRALNIPVLRAPNPSLSLRFLPHVLGAQRAVIQTPQMPTGPPSFQMMPSANMVQLLPTTPAQRFVVAAQSSSANVVQPVATQMFVTQPTGQSSSSLLLTAPAPPPPSHQQVIVSTPSLSADVLLQRPSVAPPAPAPQALQLPMAAVASQPLFFPMLPVPRVPFIPEPPKHTMDAVKAASSGHGTEDVASLSSSGAAAQKSLKRKHPYEDQSRSYGNDSVSGGGDRNSVPPDPTASSSSGATGGTSSGTKRGSSSGGAGGASAAKKPKKFIRTAAGEVWEDQTLSEWDPNDYRIFCGDLGNEVSDELLAKAFRKYTSFQKAKVVRDKRTNKTKGYGFVSFKDPQDFIRAMREMNGKYVGNRPIKLRKSEWRERSLDTVKKKMKEKVRLGLRV